MTGRQKFVVRGYCNVSVANVVYLVLCAVAVFHCKYVHRWRLSLISCFNRFGACRFVCNDFRSGRHDARLRTFAHSLRGRTGFLNVDVDQV